MRGDAPLRWHWRRLRCLAGGEARVLVVGVCFPVRDLGRVPVAYLPLLLLALVRLVLLPDFIQVLFETHSNKLV